LILKGEVVTVSERRDKFRRRELIGRTTAMGVLVLSGVFSMGDAEAAQSGVRCGSVVTRDIRLTADLHCVKDGLKVGANGVHIDLGGHAIVGPGRAGTKGIQNPGYDDVAITNGAVRGFDRGIELRKGADGNEILGMDVRAGHHGLVLFDSDSARVDDNTITAGGATDGYDGGFGAAIALYRSHNNWFEENGSRDNGVNVVVLDHSHGNGITETGFVGEEPFGEGAGGDGTGLILLDSDNNEIAGNTFARNARDGIFIDGKSTGNSLDNNVAFDNGKLGINVKGTAVVGSPNRAFANGWSAQCRGIPCVGK
jgi:parallel beta-helix repeat protein